MAKTPAGITSSVKAEGKSFILQTEFVVAPPGNSDSGEILTYSGKIVTTVAVSGQVVHKVEKSYDTSWETEEKFIKAEQAVKEQHISVAGIVSSRPDEFLNTVTQIDIMPEDKLRMISGVAEVQKIDFNNPTETPEDPVLKNSLLQNIDKLRDLVVMISKNTRMGKLQKAVGTIDNEKFMLTGLKGNTYILKLNNDVNVTQALKELENIKVR